MFNFNLRGLGDLLRLGKKGLYIKKDGDKVQFRNSDDTDFINGQALDPVDPQDVVTLQYFQDNSDLGTFNLNKSLFKNLNYQSASPTQIGIESMPSLGLAYKVLIHVKSSFNGTNPILSIGDSGDNSKLASVNLSDLADGEVYVVTVSEIYSTDTVINAYLSPDSSTQGEIDVTVLYTISEATTASITFDLLNNLIVPIENRTFSTLPTGFASNTFLGSFTPSIGDKRFSQLPTFTYAKVNNVMYFGGLYTEWNGSTYDTKSCIYKVDDNGNYEIDFDFGISVSTFIPRFVKGTDIYLSVNANGGWIRYDTVNKTSTNVSVTDKDSSSLLGIVITTGVIEEGTPVALQANDSTVYLSNPDITNINAPTFPLTFNCSTASFGAGATGLLVGNIGDVKLLALSDETTGGGIVLQLRSNAITYNATYYVIDKNDATLSTLRKVGDGDSTQIVNSSHYNQSLNLLYIVNSSGQVLVFDASAGAKNLAVGGDTPEYSLTISGSISTICPMQNGNVLFIDVSSGGPQYIVEKDLNNTVVNSLLAGVEKSSIGAVSIGNRWFVFNGNFYLFARYQSTTNEYHLEKITGGLLTSSYINWDVLASGATADAQGGLANGTFLSKSTTVLSGDFHVKYTMNTANAINANLYGGFSTDAILGNYNGFTGITYSVNVQSISVFIDGVTTGTVASQYPLGPIYEFELIRTGSDFEVKVDGISHSVTTCSTADFYPCAWAENSTDFIIKSEIL